MAGNIGSVAAWNDSLGTPPGRLSGVIGRGRDVVDDTFNTGQPAGLDRFEIRREISGRGVGTVYEAVDTVTGEPVALKAYQPTFAIQDNFGWQSAARSDYVEGYDFGLRQFLREAEALQRCSHPSIVTLRDCFEERGGAFWVMDLAAGETLADRLDAPSRPDEAEVRALIMPLVGALTDLHDNGTLHLNLRPENICLDGTGRPRLVGFAMTRTAVYRRLGPELRSGETTRLAPNTYAALELSTWAEPADPATDIYGLAAICYHLVTGTPPLHATARARHGTMPGVFEEAAGAYSDQLLRFIDAGLELHIDDRPADVAAWGRMLLAA